MEHDYPREAIITNIAKKKKMFTSNKLTMGLILSVPNLVP